MTNQTILFILTLSFLAYFWKKGVGRFLHHTPTEIMKSPTSAQEGIKLAWRLACATDIGCTGDSGGD